MRKNVTEIVFLLDKSGSMAGLEHDTIGGFNALVEKQCQLEGDTLLTTVLFDHEYEVLWKGVDATKVKLTEKDYKVRGYTALLDAVGKTILDVDQRLSQTSKEHRPDKVIFVITTDGMENASKEFTYIKVQELINRQKEQHQWEFIFLGANIDVENEADSIGVHVDDAYTFEASHDGLEKMYNQINEELVVRRRK